MNDIDTGLVYMQQRYYDPIAGRFLSIDPVVTDANTGGSFNRYNYAENNPYKFIDPDGRSSCGATEGLTCHTSVSAGPSDSNKGNAGGNSPSFDKYRALDIAANYFSGMGDILSGGATSYIRDEYSIGSVDTTAGSYRVGQGTGIAVGFAIGGAVAARAIGPFGTGSVQVTSWASAGATPVLSSGKYVMLGGATRLNFFLTGLSGWQWTFATGFYRAAAPFTPITGFVSAAALRYPSGIDFVKGTLGQRVIR